MGAGACFSGVHGRRDGRDLSPRMGCGWGWPPAWRAERGTNGCTPQLVPPMGTKKPMKSLPHRWVGPMPPVRTAGRLPARPPRPATVSGPGTGARNLNSTIDSDHSRSTAGHGSRRGRAEPAARTTPGPRLRTQTVTQGLKIAKKRIRCHETHQRRLSAGIGGCSCCATTQPRPPGADTCLSAKKVTIVRESPLSRAADRFYGPISKELLTPCTEWWMNRAG